MTEASEAVGVINPLLSMEEDLKERFTWPEYLVFAALLAASMGIGVFYGCFGTKNKTNEEFLMAGRSMSVFPVTLSVLCSFVSAITLLGNPVEVYFYGTQYFIVILCFIPMSAALAYLYVPVYFKLQLTSAYEYFELRFNRTVRRVISFASIVHLLIYMPTTVYGPSIALEQVAGINGIWSSAVIFLVCIAYSSVGGLKAVLWTDTLQAFVMLASLISVIVIGAWDVGGFDVVWNLAESTGRTTFFDFDTDPRTRHTFWTGAVGQYFNWIVLFAATQAQIQRYLSVPTLKQARQCIWLNMLGLILIVFLCSLTGLVIFAKYIDCDPVKAHKVSSAEQLLPFFVMDVLGNIPGLPGLFVAGITAGSLSTVSSALNAMAALVTEDFVNVYRPGLSQETLGYISKVISAVGGLIAFAIIFVIAAVGNILPFAVLLHGLFLGPIFGIFTLGMFFPWATAAGSMLAMIPAIGVTLFMGLGSIISSRQGLLPDQKLPLFENGCSAQSNWTGDLDYEGTSSSSSWKDTEYPLLINLFSFSYVWLPVITILSMLIFGLLFSFLSCNDKDKRKLIPKKLLCSPVLKLWICVLGKDYMSDWVDFSPEIPSVSHSTIAFDQDNVCMKADVILPNMQEKVSNTEHENELNGVYNKY